MTRFRVHAVLPAFRGDKVQLLGVDANPDATTVADVLAYSRAHGMVNQWDFLTGSLPRLKSTWRGYDIAVQIEQGQIDHTPALFVIDQQGRERKLYLTGPSPWARESRAWSCSSPPGWPRSMT